MVEAMSLANAYKRHLDGSNGMEASNPINSEVACIIVCKCMLLCRLAYGRAVAADRSAFAHYIIALTMN